MSSAIVIKGDELPDVMLAWFDDGVGVFTGTNTATGFLTGSYDYEAHGPHTAVLRDGDEWHEDNVRAFAVAHLACNRLLT